MSCFKGSTTGVVGLSWCCVWEASVYRDGCACGWGLSGGEEQDGVCDVFAGDAGL